MPWPGVKVGSGERQQAAGYDAKACPIARGKFDSKKHGFGQVHGLI